MAAITNNTHNRLRIINTFFHFPNNKKTEQFSVDTKVSVGKVEFDRKLRELDSDAVKMRGQVDHNRSERRSVYEGGKDR